MISTCFKAKLLSETEDEAPPQKQFNKLNFFDENIDWLLVNRNLNEVDWDGELHDEDPNIILDKFYMLCYNACKEVIPIKKNSTSKKHPRIVRHRRTLIKRRRKLTKRLSKCTSPIRKSKITQELLEIEKKLQKSFRESQSHMEGKAVEAIKTNSKYFFSYAKKKSKVKSKIGPLLNSEGNLTQRNKEMAEILSQQYCKMFSKPKGDTLTMDSTATQDINPINITEKDLIDAITELSPSAAAGPDGFSATMLKNCKSELSVPLTILWKKSLQKGIVPNKLKESIITPLHKGGNKSLASNYRPVALTSHLIKIFEKILRKHIVKHMNDNHLFNSNQHGFRSGRSCLSQLLEQFDIILNILDDDANVDVVYLDFSKAFDKVDHAIVLQKIRNLGIKGDIYQWLKSFLTGRFQSVTVNGVLSDPQNVISGVPQGSVLGPLIFLILLGDIDNDVLHSFVKSFADDTRVTKSVRSREDAQLLQNDLDKIYEWTTNNNMELNDLKFELLRYGRNQNLKDETFYTSPSGKVITTKDVVKDLGVQMSNDCLFKKQIDLCIEKAKNLISWILRSFISRDVTTMITLYKSLVIPVLEYCSVLWNPTAVGQIRQIEEIQKSYVRSINGMRDKNYWDCLKGMKMYSLQRRRERYRIIYVWKILENLVPNINNTLTTKENPRLGRLCNIVVSDPKNRRIRDSTLPIQGAKLFNTLPKHIRNMKNVPLNKFKGALDTFLNLIPDEPQITGYTACRRASSNSIIDMCKIDRC